MSCDGEFDHNRKNLGSRNETITYYPHRGFDGSLFNCANNGKTCEDPIVAIKFESILSEEKKTFYSHISDRHRHHSKTLCFNLNYKMYLLVIFIAHTGVYVVCDIWSPNFDDKIRFQIYVD